MLNPTDPAADIEIAKPVRVRTSWRDRHGIPHLDRLIYLAELAHELVSRDLKLRYKRTILGIAWSLVSPLLQWLVLSFVFRFVIHIQVERYLSFLLTGIVVWSWFQGSLAACATCVVDNASLIRRPGFPAPILPFVAVTTQFIQFLFSIPILLVAATFDGEPFSWALLALPLIMLLQFALVLGMGYFLSTFNVVYRDTKHLLDVALMLAFYVTPIFYDGKSVPVPYDKVYRLNPVLHLLEAYRAVVVTGSFPAATNLAFVAVSGGILLVLGHQHYRRRAHAFVEEM